MVGRVEWPELVQTHENVHEQRAMLVENIEKCQGLVRSKEKPPPEVIEGWLTAVVTYLEDTKYAPIQRDTMNAMDKMTVQFSRGHAKMEESNAIVSNGITEIIKKASTFIE